MTLSYFFFNTYPGYFLQVLPVALIAALLCYGFHRHRHPALPRSAAAGVSLFVAYLAALLTLTLLISWLGELYYLLFHHMPSGREHYGWSPYSYEFIPHFWKHFGREQLGNILLFLPFGFLYPLFRRGSGVLRTLLAGVGVSLCIEVIQPLLGRSFDINDLILNGLGVLLSALLFALIHRRFPRKEQESHESRP